MKKIFTIALLRDLEKQIIKGEISYSRMVEILNEKAWEGYSDIPTMEKYLKDRWITSEGLIKEDGVYKHEIKTIQIGDDVIYPSLNDGSRSSIKFEEIRPNAQDLDKMFGIENTPDRWRISKQAKLLLNTKDIDSETQFNSYEKIATLSLERDEYEKIYYLENNTRFAKIESNSGWNRIYYEFETELIHNVFIPDDMSGNHMFSIQVLEEVNPEYDN